MNLDQLLNALDLELELLIDERRGVACSKRTVLYQTLQLGQTSDNHTRNRVYARMRVAIHIPIRRVYNDTKHAASSTVTLLDRETHIILCERGER